VAAQLVIMIGHDRPTCPLPCARLLADGPPWRVTREAC